MKHFLVIAACLSLNSVVFGANISTQYVCMNESQSVITSLYLSPANQTYALSVYNNTGTYLSEANIESLDVSERENILLVTALSTKKTGSRFLQIHLEPMRASDFADGQDVTSRQFKARLLLGNVVELKAYDMTCDAFSVLE